VNIAVPLPHIEASDGVLRAIEIGNALVRRGHRFTLFTPEGLPPSWIEFAGEVRPFRARGDETFDVGVCGDYSVAEDFDAIPAETRWFYFSSEGDAKEKLIVRRSYRFLGNSEGLCRKLELRYPITCHRAPGGIDPKVFHRLESGERESRPEGEFRILTSGQIDRRNSGVDRVIRAVEGIHRRNPGIRLVFIDAPAGRDRAEPASIVRTRVPCEFHLDPPRDRLARLISRADVFVGAERRAGWFDSAAEAMACGIPVVCTPAGTTDFAVDGVTALVAPLGLPFLLRRRILRLMADPSLRNRLSRAGSAKIRDFTWDFLASRLEGIFGRT